MKCPDCGYEERRDTAIFCIQCGTCIRPNVLQPSTGLQFPALFDLRCWLEGEPERPRFFGPYCRRFALSFAVMPQPKQTIAVDGNLHLEIKGVFNAADLSLDVRLKREEFCERRFDLMMTSYRSLSYIYRHPQPAIPVPTDGGCRVSLTVTADTGESYAATRESYFIDQEPGTGDPPAGPWTPPQR